MKLGARPSIGEQLLLARHGKALPVALRFFGTGGETLLLVVLLGLIARAGRPFAQAYVKSPLAARIQSVFFREPCPSKLSFLKESNHRAYAASWLALLTEKKRAVKEHCSQELKNGAVASKEDKSKLNNLVAPPHSRLAYAP